MCYQSQPGVRESETMKGEEAPYTAIEDGPEKPELPVYKLILATVALVGVQFCWAVEFAVVTPHFNNTLDISITISALVWAIGPITGFLVQPIVGTMSDNCDSKYGRRRPYIAGGLVILVISMIIFSNSVTIGEWFGDTEDSKTAAIALSVFAFWWMDVSINAVQGPLRTLIADISPPSQQELGQSIGTLMQAAGDIAAFGIGSGVSDDIPIYFLIAYVVLTVTVLITIFSVSEVPHTRSENEKHGVVNALKRSTTNVRHMPSGLGRLCIVQVFVWFAWFCFLPFVTSWMGHVIYGGMDDSGDDYDNGKKAGSLAMMYRAVVQTGAAFGVPYFINRVGLKPLYCMSMLILSGSLLAMSLTEDKVAATLLVAVTGISFAATNIFPFAIIGKYYPGPSAGLYMGMLNIFIVIPQLIDTAFTGSVADWRMDATSAPRYEAAVFAFGAGFALVAALCTLALRLREPTEPQHQSKPTTTV